MRPEDFRPDSYDPCPCESGKKYKFCCGRSVVRTAIGTVALYGPDDSTTTKIVASVVDAPDGGHPLERWVKAGVLTDPDVRKAVMRFLVRHRAGRIVVTAGNLGCPHEEGLDFPNGEQCPFCPFWHGRQGSGRWL